MPNDNTSPKPEIAAQQKTGGDCPSTSCCASFEREYLGMPYTPTKEEIRLRELAEEYHQRTEEYDRKVCTGPIHNSAIMPADGLEFVSINRNARRVREMLWEEVRALRFSRQQWMEAISDAALRLRHNADVDASALNQTP
jgi:hypothetical protein